MKLLILPKIFKREFKRFYLYRYIDNLSVTYDPAIKCSIG